MRVQAAGRPAQSSHTPTPPHRPAPFRPAAKGASGSSHAHGHHPPLSKIHGASASFPTPAARARPSASIASPSLGQAMPAAQLQVRPSHAGGQLDTGKPNLSRGDGAAEALWNALLKQSSSNDSESTIQLSPNDSRLYSEPSSTLLEPDPSGHHKSNVNSKSSANDSRLHSQLSSTFLKPDPSGHHQSNVNSKSPGSDSRFCRQPSSTVLKPDPSGHHQSNVNSKSSANDSRLHSQPSSTVLKPDPSGHHQSNVNSKSSANDSRLPSHPSSTVLKPGPSSHHQSIMNNSNAASSALLTRGATGGTSSSTSSISHGSWAAQDVDDDIIDRQMHATERLPSSRHSRMREETSCSGSLGSGNRPAPAYDPAALGEPGKAPGTEQDRLQSQQCAGMPYTSPTHVTDNSSLNELAEALRNSSQGRQASWLDGSSDAAGSSFQEVVQAWENEHPSHQSPGSLHGTAPARAYMKLVPQKQQSLLDGSFDEAGGSASFQEAVQAWRDEHPSCRSLSKPHTAAPAAAAAASCNVIPQETLPLMDGSFDETGEEASVQEAVQATRNGQPACHSQSKSHTTASASAPTGTSGRVQSAAAASLHTIPQEQPSLLDGSFDEAGASASFQHAVHAWRDQLPACHSQRETTLHIISCSYSR